MTREEEWTAEIESADWPEVVKQAARRYPVYYCYRSTESPHFHYVILNYAHYVPNPGVAAVPHARLTLLHGADSALPGIATFGQLPEQLIVCDCGHWAPASEAQTQATHKRMLAIAKRS